MKTILVYPIVEVQWRDSASTHGWRNAQECKEESGLSLCSTVGYMVHRDRKEIHLFQSINEHGRVAEEWTIPMSTVVRIKHVGRTMPYHAKPKKKRR